MDQPYIMWKIEKSLNDSGYATLNFDYASTKWTMDSVCTVLNQQIEAVGDQYRQIHFVVHSLGGLVARAYLSRYQTGKEGRLVMIATPNQGSIIAEDFKNFPAFKWLLGPAGQKLGKDKDDYYNLFPPPKIPFGIVAGGLKNRSGLNPLIPGDDDWIVGVEETKLDGCADFIQIIGSHTTLLWQNDVIRQIHSFLQRGAFNQ